MEWPKTVTIDGKELTLMYFWEQYPDCPAVYKGQGNQDGKEEEIYCRVMIKFGDYVIVPDSTVGDSKAALAAHEAAGVIYECTSEFVEKAKQLRRACEDIISGCKPGAIFQAVFKLEKNLEEVKSVMSVEWRPSEIKRI